MCRASKWEIPFESAGHPLASAAEACRTDRKGRKDREGRETELGVGRRPLRC